MNIIDRVKLKRSENSLFTDKVSGKPIFVFTSKNGDEYTGDSRFGTLILRS